MHLSDQSTIHQVQIYLHLIKTTLRIKKEFEVDIHPNSLLKFQSKYYEIVNQMCGLILDLVEIPKSDLLTRMTCTDFIVEHIERKTITKEHLIERLFSWENFVIMEQAD